MGTKAGILYAIETVNSDPSFLDGYQLEPTFGDSQCSDIYGPLVAIDMYLNRTADAFIGPACDYAVAPIARFSPHWNIPVVTGGALVRALSDKASQYKLLTRIGPTYAKIGDLFLKLMTRFNWNHTAAIYSDNLGVNKHKGKTSCYFTIEGVYPTLKALYGPEKYFAEDFDENSEETNITRLLMELSEYARGMYVRVGCVATCAGQRSGFWHMLVIM